MASQLAKNVGHAVEPILDGGAKLLDALGDPCDVLGVAGGIPHDVAPAGRARAGLGGSAAQPHGGVRLDLIGAASVHLVNEFRHATVDIFAVGPQCGPRSHVGDSGAVVLQHRGHQQGEVAAGGHGTRRQTAVARW